MIKKFILVTVLFSMHASAAEMIGNWVFHEEKNEITDKTDAYASIAKESAYEKGGISRYLALSVRCAENTTDFQITFNDYVPNDYSKVSYRIDEGKPITENWITATNGSGVFSPHAIKMLKSLKGKNKLTVGFTPYGRQMVTQSFYISGIDQVIDRISKSCGWK